MFFLHHCLLQLFFPNLQDVENHNFTPGCQGGLPLNGSFIIKSSEYVCNNRTNILKY